MAEVSPPVHPADGAESKPSVARPISSGAAQRFKIDRRPLFFVVASRLRRQLWIGLVLAIFALALGMTPPTGLAIAGWRTLCVFGLCVALWASALLPLAITSLLAIACVPLLDIMPANEAYRYFGSKVVFFILGAFMLSAALTTSGLSKRVATSVVRRFGSTPPRLVMAVFLLCALAATVMSSHAVAAMVFPIVVDIARALNLRPLRSKLGMSLFFAMAWGAIIGGSLTILGGGRGPLAIGLLEEFSSGLGAPQTIAFGHFIAFAAPMVLMMLGAAAFMLHRLEPEITSTAPAQERLAAALHDMGKTSGREMVVGLTVIITVALWMFAGDTLGLANIAIVAMTALFVLGAMRWREVEENVNWGVLVMYGGAICLGGAMESSGAAKWLTQVLIPEGLSPKTLLVLFALISAVLTEFMSNSAVVAMLMPPALAMGASLGIDLAAVTMVIVLPSNFAFMFPVSTPVTAIAWSAGYYSPSQVAGRGLQLHLVGFAAMLISILFIWPALGLL